MFQVFTTITNISLVVDRIAQSTSPIPLRCIALHWIVRRGGYRWFSPVKLCVCVCLYESVYGLPFCLLNGNVGLSMVGLSFLPNFLSFFHSLFIAAHSIVLSFPST